MVFCLFGFCVKLSSIEGCYAVGDSSLCHQGWALLRDTVLLVTPPLGFRALCHW